MRFLFRIFNSRDEPSMKIYFALPLFLKSFYSWLRGIKSGGIFSCVFIGLGMLSHDQAFSQQPYPNSHFIEIDNLNIHYQHSPISDTPQMGKVVLLHGFACSTYSWRKNIPALVQAGYEVVAIDIPPFGYSDRPKEQNLSFSAQAELVWRVLDQISTAGDNNWHLVGHSMSAATVGAMAVLRPEQTTSVAYVDGIVFNSGKGPLHSIQWLMRPKALVWPVSWFGQWVVISRKRVKTVLSRAYGRPATREEVAGYLEPLRQKGTARSVIDLFAYARPVFPYSTDSIRSPGVIIWGERDLIPMREARELQNQLIGVDLISLPGAAHCPMETHTEVFNEVLLQFFEQVQSNISSESK